MAMDHCERQRPLVRRRVGSSHLRIADSLDGCRPETTTFRAVHQRPLPCGSRLPANPTCIPDRPRGAALTTPNAPRLRFRTHVLRPSRREDGHEESLNDCHALSLTEACRWKGYTRMGTSLQEPQRASGVPPEDHSVGLTGDEWICRRDVGSTLVGWFKAPMRDSRIVEATHEPAPVSSPFRK